MSLTTAQVKAKLKAISAIQLADRDDKGIATATDKDIATINALHKEIEDGGWHLQAKAYRKDFTSAKGRRYHEWWVVIAYVSGKKNIEYSNCKANNKAHALETQARYP